ncbi:hypothetical protein [Carboxylicivirga caseinilyticus]|uniref:hypothetical protein n=1 Tax=Carboxylicivirga caseinilyticus TaxID=3417572 RepID=UPI003D33F6CD|nr:hypothetical protein [Marinilabiliaceae bacterium A049]
MTRKLKPDRSIKGLVPAIVSFIVFFFCLIVFNLQTAFKILGILMIIYAFLFGFWSFYKTNNYYLLISTFYLLTLGLVMLSIQVPENLNGPAPSFNIEFKLGLLFVYIFLFWLMYLVFQKKLKYRGREIMELAAWDVEEGSASYTERPRPAGKVNYSKYDLIDFGNYLKKILVCMTYVESNRIVLVPVKMGEEYPILYNPGFDYLKETWIAFDFDGEVSVHISQKDYLDYRDDLAFDNLCESLGKLMITFADFYMNGSKVRILDRLNSVKIGLFS